MDAAFGKGSALCRGNASGPRRRRSGDSRGENAFGESYISDESICRILLVSTSKVMRSLVPLLISPTSHRTSTESPRRQDRWIPRQEVHPERHANGHDCPPPKVPPSRKWPLPGSAADRSRRRFEPCRSALGGSQAVRVWLGRPWAQGEAAPLQRRRNAPASWRCWASRSAVVPGECATTGGGGG